MTTKRVKATPQYSVIEPEREALEAFVTNSEPKSIDGLTKKRVCVALAADLLEDDIRETQFNIRYREPNQHSPTGTLLVSHPKYDNFTELAITSVERTEKHENKEIPVTLWSVFHPTPTDILTITEDRGCLISLKEASSIIVKKRIENTSPLNRFKRKLVVNYLR
jgi:hypothetical protein